MQDIKLLSQVMSQLVVVSFASEPGGNPAFPPFQHQTASRCCRHGPLRQCVPLVGGVPVRQHKPLCYGAPLAGPGTTNEELHCHCSRSSRVKVKRRPSAWPTPPSQKPMPSKRRRSSRITPPWVTTSTRCGFCCARTLGSPSISSVNQALSRWRSSAADSPPGGACSPALSIQAR